MQNFPELEVNLRLFCTELHCFLELCFCLVCLIYLGQNQSQGEACGRRMGIDLHGFLEVFTRSLVVASIIFHDAIQIEILEVVGRGLEQLFCEWTRFSSVSTKKDRKSTR